MELADLPFIVSMPKTAYKAFDKYRNVGTAHPERMGHFYVLQMVTSEKIDNQLESKLVSQYVRKRALGSSAEY